LLIEVAESSLDYQVEVHSAPQRGVYTRINPCGADESVSPAAFRDVVILVRRLIR
jgi:hypothetical protein